MSKLAELIDHVSTNKVERNQRRILISTSGLHMNMYIQTHKTHIHINKQRGIHEHTCKKKKKVANDRWFLVRIPTREYKHHHPHKVHREGAAPPKSGLRPALSGIALVSLVCLYKVLGSFQHNKNIKNRSFKSYPTYNVQNLNPSFHYCLHAYIKTSICM